MVRVANGLSVASLRSPGFCGRRRALPGKTSYSTGPEFLGPTTGGRVWRGG